MNINPNLLCPKCNELMESPYPYDADFSSLSDGQIADFDAFGNVLICNKCNIVAPNVDHDDFYEPSDAQKEGWKKTGRTNWSNRDIRGFIAEMHWATQLRNEGYKVRKTMIYDYNTGKSIPNIDGIKDLLSGHLDYKIIYELFSRFNSGYPDLICLKDKKIVFYEIKSNSSIIRENQIIVIDVIKSMGYTVEIKEFDVEFSIKEKE